MSIKNIFIIIFLVAVGGVVVLWEKGNMEMEEVSVADDLYDAVREPMPVEGVLADGTSIVYELGKSYFGGLVYDTTRYDPWTREPKTLIFKGQVQLSGEFVKEGDSTLLVLVDGESELSSLGATFVVKPYEKRSWQKINPTTDTYMENIWVGVLELHLDSDKLPIVKMVDWSEFKEEVYDTGERVFEPGKKYDDLIFKGVSYSSGRAHWLHFEGQVEIEGEYFIEPEDHWLAGPHIYRREFLDGSIIDLFGHIVLTNASDTFTVLGQESLDAVKVVIKDPKLPIIESEILPTAIFVSGEVLH